MPYTVNAFTGELDYYNTSLLCDNGATLPSAPVTGQWFYHTPTGRGILLFYNGTYWKPFRMMVATTMYVDVTNGTDAQDKGYGTGANAFKTLAYAISQLPGIIDENVTINLAVGTYTDVNTVLREKAFTGNYTLTILCAGGDIKERICHLTGNL